MHVSHISSNVFCTCHKCSLYIEHPCSQVPLDSTKGYDPELAQ